MKKIVNPLREDWPLILARPELEGDELSAVCRGIFAEVKKAGDEALRKYTWFFDKVRVDDFKVTEKEFEEAEKWVDEMLKEAIRLAGKNIEAFHRMQCPDKAEYADPRGFKCWQEIRAIEKVGLYIPGGSAPLFSTVLMLAIPAHIACCKKIVMCTPPDREGNVHPAILWAARFCGITEVYKVGGVQAIAGMTFGTETIPGVYKIFGPGNQYVTTAKQLAVNYGVAIDMPAGPSEVLVVADGTACPEFVAADLLSQAEHGADSQVLLVTWEEGLLAGVEKELSAQLQCLPRKEIAEKALENSRCIVVSDAKTAIELSNEYAPEHLILCVDNYETFIPEITNAGSVFLGNYSPESAGDYASGTNHTLPTNSYTRAYSGVGIDSFIKKISFQEITRNGLEYLAPAIETMAENERLYAHKNAVSVRINKKNDKQ